MQRIGLYYPYIHCRDEQWLKLTALYWPHLARVVPNGYPVADSDTAAALNDDLDFMITTRPDAAAKAIAPLFLELLREHGAELEAEHGVRQAAQASQFSVTAEPGPSWEPGETIGVLPRNSLAGLHEDEVAPELKGALIDSGLALSTERSRFAQQSFTQRSWGNAAFAQYSLAHAAPEVRWVAMRPSLAWIYKCVLTEELARRSRYIPLTDQPASHGVYGWDSDRLAQALLNPLRSVPTAEEDLTEAIGLMSVRLVVPDNLDAVPVEKIIQLRKRHRAEFEAFANAVNTAAADFRDSFGAIEDRDARQKYLSLKVAETFETPLEELRKAMRGLKMNTAFSAMSSKFELGTAATVAIGSIPAGQPLVTAGAVALGLTTLRRNAAQAREAQMRTTPGAYLLRAERDLQPQELHQRVMRGIGKFVGFSP
ncbi:DUF6236 family protein [Streptomyces sp. NBC_00286]|uniref:DUF6236 family protein n=1 Tax=Streptomyces sp. NBC_00286 TaxID=2975701 RepID=UPI002E2856CE|nr:DUF6236 family protein [Streptomyces sp. NBC_00286]